MESNNTIYMAGLGMVTPIGACAATVSAAFHAEYSAYMMSDYDDSQGNPITMASVPEEIFSDIKLKPEPGEYYREQYTRIIKLAVFALNKAIDNAQINLATISRPIPLIIAISEPELQESPLPAGLLAHHLCQLTGIATKLLDIRSIHTGRSAFIEGIALAQRFFDESGSDYVIIGGSDSYWGNAALFNKLDKDQRLLHSNNRGGFAPSEAASFLVLSQQPSKALQINQQVIKLHPPGLAQEQGHVYSQAAYKGEGLDQAFKQALNPQLAKPVNVIFSSMNGENYWAKEYGVAVIRNKPALTENFTIEHPADCYGEIGVATAGVLIGLSAMQLFKRPQEHVHLVYSSADGPGRAALCLEKTLIHGAAVSA